jgi:hypothetical protein
LLVVRTALDASPTEDSFDLLNDERRLEVVDMLAFVEGYSVRIDLDCM